MASSALWGRVGGAQQWRLACTCPRAARYQTQRNTVKATLCRQPSVDHGGMAAAQKLNYRVRLKLESFYTGGAVRLSNDGKLLACACGDEVKVVEVATGAVLHTLPGDSEPVTALALSPNGHLLFSASRSLQQRCWSLETGQAVRSFKGHRAPIADLVCDRSGGLLASAGADRSVRVWDVDGGFCTHAFTGHSGVVLRVLFHPRQLLLASAGDDAEVRVWDLVTKGCSAVLKGHYSAVTSLAFAPDGWTLLSGGRDGVVMAWCMRTHDRLATVPVFEAVEGLAFLPLRSPFPGVPADVKKPVCFVTGGEKGRLKVWRIDTAACVYEEPPAAAPEATAGNIVELQLLPGAAGVMTATQDCRIQIHRPQDGQLALARQLVGNNDEVTDLRLLSLLEPPPPGKPAKKKRKAQHTPQQQRGQLAEALAPTHLAVSTNSEHIRLFDCASLGCAATLAGHSDIVLCLDALRTAEGQTLLASGSKDNAVRVWALPQGRCIGLGEGHVGAVGAVAFARRGGGFLVTGGADKLLKVWDVAKLDAGAQSPAKLKVTAAVAAHDKDINSVAVSPNDALICTGSQDRTVKIWKLPNLVLSKTLRGHKRGVWAVAFSPVDQVVATASGDKTVRLWSLADSSCLRTFEGHLASVLRVSFLSVGTQLLTSGADGLVKLWNVRSAECTNTFDAHEDKVWALTVGGPAEGVVATGGGDGAVALWEDCTEQDAAAAAAEAQEAVLREQDMLNALQDEDYQRAASLAFEMRQPGRLLTVLIKAFERGPQEAQRILARLAGGMGAEELRQCLEFVREWNTNAKTSFAAQSVLQALLQHHPPQALLGVPGLHGLMEGLVPYTQRHFNRVDRLLRSTYLVDYVLGAMSVLVPEDGEEEAAGTAVAMASEDEEESGEEARQQQQQHQQLAEAAAEEGGGEGAAAEAAGGAAAADVEVELVAELVPERANGPITTHSVWDGRQNGVNHLSNYESDESESQSELEDDD